MRVLITGVRGQDGSILAEIHSQKGDQVWGTVSSANPSPILNDIEIVTEGLEKPRTAHRVLNQIRPDRIYHLATKHRSSIISTPLTFDARNEIYDCHVSVTRNILDWQVVNQTSRSLFALSSQMYTPTRRETLVSEDSPCCPQNYYAETKLEMFKLLRQYRENFKVKTFGAILFNHTSIKSKSDFIFPHLAKEIAKVIRGESIQICVKDSKALIDICHAEEICQGLTQIIEIDNSCDIIFSSGRLISISEIVANTLHLLEFKRDYELKSEVKSNMRGKFLFGDTSRVVKFITWQALLPPEDILLQLVCKELNL